MIARGYTPEQMIELNPHRKEGRLPRCVAGMHPAEATIAAIVAISCAVPGLLITVHVAMPWIASLMMLPW